MFFDAGFQEVVGVYALGAADDFAVAFGGEDVDAEGLGGVDGVGLHVEGLDGGGVAVDHDGFGELAGDVGLVGGAEVVAVGVGVVDEAAGVGVFEHGVGFVVGEAGKAVGGGGGGWWRSNPGLRSETWGTRLCGGGGGDDGFEFGDVAADDFEVGAMVLEDGGDDVGDEAFGEVEEAVEFEEGDFGFDHPELGEVAAGFGFFGAEGGAEAVDLAEGQGRGFDVELAGLGEVGFVVVEVVHLEELGGSFAGVGGEDGWIGADESVGVEVLGGGAHDGGADAEDGGLARGAEPEVAVLHEEVDAVLFEGDGEGGFVGDALEDVDGFDVELEAGGGAGVGADFSGDGERGLEGEIFEGFEDFFGDSGFGDDALDGAGAVAEDGEEQFAGGAEIVEPAAEGDGLAFVGCEGGDGRDG